MECRTSKSIWKAKRAEIGPAAERLLSISKETGRITTKPYALKDRSFPMEAEIRVNVCMQMNEQGPSEIPRTLDAQNAAVLIGMRDQPG